MRPRDELPDYWPKANHGELLYRLRRLTVYLITTDPLSRPGSPETQRQLQNIRNELGSRGQCKKCGVTKEELEPCEICEFYRIAELGPCAILEDMRSMEKDWAERRK
jgi:hypothetical protein